MQHFTSLLSIQEWSYHRCSQEPWTYCIDVDFIGGIVNCNLSGEVDNRPFTCTVGRLATLVDTESYSSINDIKTYVLVQVPPALQLRQR